jgi:hypothetical protein
VAMGLSREHMPKYRVEPSRSELELNEGSESSDENDDKDDPWITNVFDTGPENSIRDSEQASIFPSLASSDDETSSIHGFGSQRPLPEIPPRTSSIHQRSISGASSNAPSITPSLLEYIERDESSPEPKIGIARVLVITPNASPMFRPELNDESISSLGDVFDAPSRLKAESEQYDSKAIQEQSPQHIADLSILAGRHIHMPKPRRNPADIGTLSGFAKGSPDLKPRLTSLDTLWSSPIQKSTPPKTLSLVSNSSERKRKGMLPHLAEMCSLQNVTLRKSNLSPRNKPLPKLVSSFSLASIGKKSRVPSSLSESLSHTSISEASIARQYRVPSSLSESFSHAFIHEASIERKPRVPSSISQISEAEWMGREPSPLKDDPEKLRVARIWSPGPGDRRVSPGERSALREKSARQLDSSMNMNSESPEETPTRTKYTKSSRSSGHSWF